MADLETLAGETATLLVELHEQSAETVQQLQSVDTQIQELGNRSEQLALF